MPLAQHTDAPLDPHAPDVVAAREQLLADRAELVRTLDDVADDTTIGPSDVPDGIGETEHLVDAEQAELSGRVGALTRQALDELDAALARLDDGTYGLCTGCGGRIPAERLEALPAAACCVTCQSRSERFLR